MEGAAGFVWVFFLNKGKPLFLIVTLLPGVVEKKVVSRVSLVLKLGFSNWVRIFNVAGSSYCGIFQAPEGTGKP